MAPYLSNGTEEQESENTPQLLEICCGGTPYEIGFQHGKEAKLHVSRTIGFYTKMFRDYAKLDWGQVRQIAMTSFRPVIEERWPRYLEEMRGVAGGAGFELADIIACNVRTEIAYGLFSDGCTALAWRTEKASFLAQNWDWHEAQKQNVIVLTIEQPDKPTIKMVTEAGLIGKIGLNSAGVGVCLNAIAVTGMDQTRLPCHLGLRMALESPSRDEAVKRLEEYMIASACHFLIADAEGSIGLEWSSADLKKCIMNERQQVLHCNHYLESHPHDDTEEHWLANSKCRQRRTNQLADEVAKPDRESILDIFKDQEDYPGSICRAQQGSSTAATLFNIVMDLKEGTANVILGKPTAPEAFLTLAF